MYLPQIGCRLTAVGIISHQNNFSINIFPVLAAKLLHRIAFSLQMEIDANFRIQARNEDVLWDMIVKIGGRGFPELVAKPNIQLNKSISIPSYWRGRSSGISHSYGDVLGIDSAFIEFETVFKSLGCFWTRFYFQQYLIR